MRMTNVTASVVGAAGERLAASFHSQVNEGRDAFSHGISWLSERWADFMLDAVSAVVLFLLGWLAIRLIAAAVSRALTRGGKKRTLFTDFATSVTTKGCWALLIVMVLGRLGINVGPLIAGLGVTGFILGFAFQESLGNLASGLMIAINEPFKVGDFVEIAGLSGTVVSVNIMAPVLATADNKKLVVPNKNAWGSPITNYAALGVRRIDLTVGIAYGEDIARAVDIAYAAVLSVPGVLEEPPPKVAPFSLDESSVTLVVRPWAKVEDYWTVHAETLKAVKSAFDREGVQIPFPQMDVHIAGGAAAIPAGRGAAS